MTCPSVKAMMINYLLEMVLCIYFHRLYLIVLVSVKMAMCFFAVWKKN